MLRCGAVFIDFGGGDLNASLYLLDLNACFSPQIREVLSYDLSKYTFWSSVSVGALWNPNYT